MATNHETALNQSVFANLDQENRREREGEFCELKPLRQPAPTAQVTSTIDPGATIFTDDDCRILRAHWDALQVDFVDDPSRTVERADQLVTEAVNALTKSLIAEREKLAQEWHANPKVTTEDLRLVFRRYRSSFDRILSL
jgi:hypothetical protein